MERRIAQCRPQRKGAAQMFQDSFIEATARTNRGWTVLASSALQTALVSALLVVPLLRPELLPKTLLQTMLAVPPMPPPPPPPPAATQTAPVQHAVLRHFDSVRLFEPKAVPDKVAILADADLPVAQIGVPGGIEGGVPGGTGTTADSLLNNLVAKSGTPPPVAKAEPPAVIPRLQVGGNVQAGKLKYGPKPIYPPLALQTRTEGTVQLTAVIGRDGTVLSLSVVSGHPMLVQAALQAVRQWRYAPTLLNGDPVEVISPIVVSFSLNR